MSELVDTVIGVAATLSPRLVGVLLHSSDGVSPYARMTPYCGLCGSGIYYKDASKTLVECLCGKSTPGVGAPINAFIYVPKACSSKDWHYGVRWISWWTGIDESKLGVSICQ